MSTELFKPSSRGIRDPKTNAKTNGRIENPNRYNVLGGFSSSAKGFARNIFSVKKPGESVK